MTSMASSIQPRPPAMSDLRSAGEMSRGHWKGEAERKDAEHDLLLEREVNETRKEVLFLGHVASWQDLDDEPGNDLGKAFPRDKSRKFTGCLTGGGLTASSFTAHGFSSWRQS